MCVLLHVLVNSFIMAILTSIFVIGSKCMHTESVCLCVYINISCTPDREIRNLLSVKIHFLTNVNIFDPI